MTLDQIRTFLAVTRLGGVRRAATHLNISQPAVSNRLLALEDSLGVILFDRDRGGVDLTQEGIKLLPYAEILMQTVDQIRTEVVPSDNLSAILRIGVIETIAESWLAEFLPKFYRLYPNVTVEVTVDISVNLREQLMDRSLDLALLMGPLSDYKVENHNLPAFDVGWFKKKGTPDPDLATTAVITFHKQSRPFQEIQSFMTEKLGSGVRLFPTSSLSTGFEMVASGVGVGAFPRRNILEERMKDRVEIFDAGWTPSPINITASYLRENKHGLVTRAVDCFLEIAGSAS
ncbi:MAG: LysR family transcriptional regulator [Sneathiella sp.]|nr:LysR family transcriptional regulator [Sneathiella sp.]